MLVRTDEILYKKLDDLFLSLLRTQRQLHFQRSVCNCNTRNNDVLQNWNRHC